MPAIETTPVLSGTHIRLRPMTVSDVPRLFAQFSDPKVMRYWSRTPLMRMEDARELFEEIDRGVRAGQFLQWTIAMCSDDLMIGSCALFAQNAAHHRAEIGFALSSAHWGHGYAQEAVRLALDHAFGTLELHRIEADVDPHNAASLRLLERLGFVREGLLRERWHVGGEIQDSAIYALLARDYAAASTKAVSATPTAGA
ncbi:MAG: GNAT family protein [Rudaea sp.]|nr:GNAT family protein [Rudaea sp.]